MNRVDIAEIFRAAAAGMLVDGDAEGARRARRSARLVENREGAPRPRRRRGTSRAAMARASGWGRVS